MLAIAFATVTVVGITTLVLIRSLRPDRQAHGLTELAVLLSAYGAVYGPVGIGFVVQLRHGPDLSLLPPFLSGALAGALLAVLLPGGFWLAALLTLWVLRRPLELPSTRMAVRRAVLPVVALALWGIRKPWLLVGEGLLKEMPYAEVKAVLAHEIGHVIRRDHVRLLLSGLAWAAAITVCSQLVLLPLLQADRAITFITVLATFNTLYLVALGVVMRRMEYATDRLGIELLDGRGAPLASAALADGCHEGHRSGVHAQMVDKGPDPRGTGAEAGPGLALAAPEVRDGPDGSSAQGPL